MSLIQQFLKSFRESDTLEPGLFQKIDGTVWLRQPDGSEVQITGGGGSGFTGWTEDASNPADVATEGGTLIVGPADGSSRNVELDPGQIVVSDDSANITARVSTDGFASSPGAGQPAYVASDANGATVGFDSGGLPVVNLPTSDPAIAGALWNDGGTPAISAG